MAVTSFKRSLYSSNPDKYISFLAGNAAYDPAATWLISSVTGNGSATSFTFSSIPQTYSSIELRWTARNTDTANANQNAMYFQFNGDTGANYVWHNLFGTGATVAAQSGTANNNGIAYSAIQRGGATAGIMAVGIYTIQDYAVTSKNKTTRSFTGSDTNTANTNIRVNLGSNLWLSTAAINSITVFADYAFTTDSKISLYGMK